MNNVVYICGPYRAENKIEINQNILNAVKAANILRKENYACIVPHLESVYSEDTLTEDEWLEHGITLLSKCDILCIIIAKEDKPTKGMTREIDFALKNNILIMYLNDILLKDSITWQ
jgi:hypothetical protein